MTTFSRPSFYSATKALKFVVCLAMGGSEKTLKRELERARKALRDAGIPEPGKRSWYSSSWHAGKSKAGKWDQSSDASRSKAGKWESSDASGSKAGSWEARSDASSSKAGWNATWDAHADWNEGHWAAESSTSSSSLTVPPPPPPARDEPAPDPDVKVEAGLDASVEEVPDYVIYTFARGKEEPPQLDVLIDAEVIRSNSNDKETWGCCGLNGSILLEIATHPQTPELLSQIYDGMMTLDAGKKPITIGFRCKAGRHRSVAMATLMTDALISIHHGAEPVVRYHHIEQKNRPHCGCPDDCVNIVNGRVQFYFPGVPGDAVRNFWLQNGDAALVVFRRLWANTIKRKAGMLFLG